MNCEFISEFRRLSKLSSEAVENLESFNGIKEYLHVHRNTETIFKSLISKVSTVTHKQLILVCGSAGDGKSHLLSYLKHIDPEQPLRNYEIINDATESNAPDETAIETLAVKIAAFNDENIGNNGNEKVVLAINLGMLNNFLESNIGASFSKLRAYVENNSIFSVTSTLPVDVDSVFQHIDFSDYQLYSVTEEGTTSTYLLNLIRKVFAAEDHNPFYKSYEQCADCPHHTHCPVKNNYEFLMGINVQEVLVQRIIEVCIKEKVIVTSRDVLNLLFDIIVPSNYDGDKLWEDISKPLEFLMSYVSYSTPMLLFSNVGTSNLLDHIASNIVKNGVIEERDSDVLNFYAAEDVTPIVSKVLTSTVYGNVVISNDLTSIDNSRKDLKKYLFKFLMNYQYLSENAFLQKDEIYNGFIRDLYYSLAGEKAKLKSVYTSVKDAIYAWDGIYGDDLICIDDTDNNYSILETLSIKSDVLPGHQADEFYQFSPTIAVRFRNEAGTDGVIIKLDFSLYKLIMEMKAGYRPTAQDRNTHTEFVSNIREISEFGSKKRKIMIVSKKPNIAKKFIFEDGEFGFAFKEI